jgi:copper chaperone CopZ
MDKEGMTDVSTAIGGPTIVATVNGLVCDFCAQALKKVFKKEEAVKALKVDLDAGEVRIFLKEGQMLSDAVVAKLIRKSGYSLVETKREGGA